MFRHFFQDEDGQALVEYGLIIALIALVVVSVVTLFGSRIKNSLYQKAINQLPG